MGGQCFTVYHCQTCGKDFRAKKRYGNRIVKFCSTICYGISKKGISTWNKGIPMKKETKLLLSKQRKEKHASPKTEFKKGHHVRDKNANWKGGKSHTMGGYLIIISVGHPRAMMKSHYVYEHILVAEKFLNRFLTSQEVVHHINKITSDNRPENLYVFPSQAEHMRHHKNLKLGKEQSKISNLIR